MAENPEAGASAAGADGDSPDSSKTYLWIGIALVIVIVIVIVATSLSKREDGSNDGPPPPPPPPPKGVTPLPGPGPGDSCDAQALISGFIQNQNPRPPPCSSYPYINNLVVSDNNPKKKQSLYQRNKDKQGTCCFFTPDPATEILNPDILIRSSGAIPLSILNQNPYSYDSQTLTVSYILPGCDHSNSNGCAAFIRVGQSGAGIRYGVYKVYSFMGYTINPLTTYPAPPPGQANPDMPNPFALNQANIQIMKDTEYTIESTGNKSDVVKFLFKTMIYKGNVLITCPPQDTDYKTCTRVPPSESDPLFLQLLIQLFGVPVTPIPGTNPPIAHFMS